MGALCVLLPLDSLSSSSSSDEGDWEVFVGVGGVGISVGMLVGWMRGELEGGMLGE